jgi:hypothetical protein
MDALWNVAASATPLRTRANAVGKRELAEPSSSSAGQEGQHLQVDDG